jgi:acyl carrier protein
VTAYSFAGAPTEVLPAPPIGRPIANTQVYILDGELRAVPVGVVGELYIGGANLGRNYHGQAALTASKFVPHLYSDKPGQRLYRTGDVGRYLRDGNVEFLGRKDQQVKVRGYRVELGEIENELRGHGGVEEAVVVARELAGGTKQLVGYVVRRAGTVEADLTGVLKRRLQEKLPEYMVPAIVMEVEKLPLTRNGKLDRQALPAPEGKWETQFVAPRTPLEELLAGIWQTLLKRDRVGIHDNFFELGGHSLLVTQLISKIRDVFHVDIPLRTLFDFPTIDEISVAIVAHQLEQDPDEAVRMASELQNASTSDSEMQPDKPKMI